MVMVSLHRKLNKAKTMDVKQAEKIQRVYNNVRIAVLVLLVLALLMLKFVD